MRKLRAADRLLLFHCVLRAKRDHVRHLPILCDHWQPTQGTRETQGKAIQQPDHCTPLFLALALALWCVELQNCTSQHLAACSGLMLSWAASLLIGKSGEENQVGDRSGRRRASRLCELSGKPSRAQNGPRHPEIGEQQSRTLNHVASCTATLVNHGEPPDDFGEPW